MKIKKRLENMKKNEKVNAEERFTRETEKKI